MVSPGGFFLSLAAEPVSVVAAAVVVVVVVVIVVVFIVICCLFLLVVSGRFTCILPASIFHFSKPTIKNLLYTKENLYEDWDWHMVSPETHFKVT